MFVCAGADLTASCNSMPNSQPPIIIVVILLARGSCQNALPSCFFYYVPSYCNQNRYSLAVRCYGLALFCRCRQCRTAAFGQRNKGLNMLIELFLLPVANINMLVNTAFTQADNLNRQA